MCSQKGVQRWFCCLVLASFNVKNAPHSGQVIEVEQDQHEGRHEIGK